MGQQYDIRQNINFLIGYILMFFIRVEMLFDNTPYIISLKITYNQIYRGSKSSTLDATQKAGKTAILINKYVSIKFRANNLCHYIWSSIFQRFSIMMFEN